MDDDIDESYQRKQTQRALERVRKAEREALERLRKKKEEEAKLKVSSILNPDDPNPTPPTPLKTASVAAKIPRISDQDK